METWKTCRTEVRRSQENPEGTEKEKKKGSHGGHRGRREKKKKVSHGEHRGHGGVMKALKTCRTEVRSSQGFPEGTEAPESTLGTPTFKLAGL